MPLTTPEAQSIIPWILSTCACFFILAKILPFLWSAATYTCMLLLAAMVAAEIMSITAHCISNKKFALPLENEETHLDLMAGRIEITFDRTKKVSLYALEIGNKKLTWPSITLALFQLISKFNSPSVEQHDATSITPSAPIQEEWSKESECDKPIYVNIQFIREARCGRYSLPS